MIGYVEQPHIKEEDQKVVVYVDYTNGSYNIRGYKNATLYQKGKRLKESEQKSGIELSFSDPISGTNPFDNYRKENYSRELLKRRRNEIEKRLKALKKTYPGFRYSKKLIKYVDPIMYKSLQDFDGRNRQSNNRLETDNNKVLLLDDTDFSDRYLMAMTRTYPRNQYSNLSKKEYEKKCRKLRRNELKEAGIAVSYHIGLFNVSEKLSLLDRINGFIIARNQEKLIGKKAVKRSILLKKEYLLEQSNKFNNEVNNYVEKSKANMLKLDELNVDLSKKISRDSEKEQRSSEIREKNVKTDKLRRKVSTRTDSIRNKNYLNKKGNKRKIKVPFIKKLNKLRRKRTEKYCPIRSMRYKYNKKGLAIVGVTALAISGTIGILEAYNNQKIPTIRRKVDTTEQYVIPLSSVDVNQNSFEGVALETVDELPADRIQEDESTKTEETITNQSQALDVVFIDSEKENLTEASIIENNEEQEAQVESDAIEENNENETQIDSNAIEYNNENETQIESDTIEENIENETQVESDAIEENVENETQAESDAIEENVENETYVESDAIEENIENETQVESIITEESKDNNQETANYKKEIIPKEELLSLENIEKRIENLKSDTELFEINNLSKEEQEELFKKTVLSKYQKVIVIGEKPKSKELKDMLVMNNQKYYETPEGTGTSGRFGKHVNFTIEFIDIKNENGIWKRVTKQGLDLYSLIQENPNIEYSIHFKGLGFVHKSQFEDITRAQAEYMMKNGENQNIESNHIDTFDEEER